MAVVIDCGLRRISNLEPVRHSLVKMCLCDQVQGIVNFCLGGLKLNGASLMQRLWACWRQLCVARTTWTCLSKRFASLLGVLALSLLAGDGRMPHTAGQKKKPNTFSSRSLLLPLMLPCGIVFLFDKDLKKMEGLCLPGLRELYLHQNKIAKIEGLDG